MIERKLLSKNMKMFLASEHISKKLPGVGLANMRVKKTPLGEKLILTVLKPGLLIGKKGSTIKEVTKELEDDFNFQKPEIELKEVANPYMNADVVAEKIKESLMRFGARRFKQIAHREMANIMRAGALGCEIVLTGRIPSQRSKRWRFREGYIKKSGQFAIDGVRTCITTAILNVGSIGIQVRIMPGDTKLPDYVNIYEEPIDVSNLEPKMKTMFKKEEKAETKKTAKKATKTTKKTAKKVAKKATKTAKKATKATKKISKEES